MPPEAANPGRIALITCGSPLLTLYRTCFPVHFSDELLSRVVANSGKQWQNFWRQTDPIASEIASEIAKHPCNKNLTEEALDRTDREKKLLGHNGYFEDLQVMEAVANVLSPHCAPTEEAIDDALRSS